MSTNLNNSVSSYVRLQLNLDDSFIDKCFQHVDKKLNRHEELINELMRLLKNKADLSDLENLKNSVLKSVDEKINDRLSEFESEMDDKISQTKSELISNFNNSIEKVSTTFDEKLKELTDRLNQLEKLSEFGTSIQKQFDEMKERVEEIERNLENEINITHNHQNSINSIILSFGGLNEQDLSGNLLNDFSKSSKITNKTQSKSNIKTSIKSDTNSNSDEDTNANSNSNTSSNTNANTDSNEANNNLNNLHNLNLTKSLTTSTTYVNEELKNLRDELQKFKDEIQIQSIINRQTPKTEPSASPPPIVIPTSPKAKVSPQQSPKSPVIQKPPQTKIIKMKDTSNNFNINDFIKDHNFIDFDFLTCHPYKTPIVHWTDPPELPKLEQLRDMYSFVDYFYHFVPKLQAHLTALHQKVTENSADIIGKCDKAVVEKMFDKFQAIVNELRKRLNDLKDAVEHTASREEINQMVDDLLMRLGSESETAAGCVKCIACGRDVAIVTGARTEKDLQRILGSPPNSIVRSNQTRSSLNALPASSSITVSTSNNNNNGSNNAIKSNGIKVTYTSRDGFDSEIVESPRSIRPSRMKVPR